MLVAAVEAAASRGARMLILDVTGVKTPDEVFVAALAKTVRAL